MHKFEDILLEFGLIHDEDYYWFVNQEERARGEFICSLCMDYVNIATEIEIIIGNEINYYYYNYQDYYTKDDIKNKIIEILKIRKEKILLAKKLNIVKDFQ